MKLVLILLITLSYLTSQDIKTEWKFQVRERSNFNETNDIGDTKHELRTRIGLKLKGESGVSVFLQLQDSRLLGAPSIDGVGNRTSIGQSGLLNNDDNIGMHQAYLSIDDFIAKNLTLMAGRMEVAYGNQRIVGSVGWHNVGRTFDGFVVRYNMPKGFLDLSHLVLGETGGANDNGDAIFNGLHLSNKVSDNLNLDAYLYDLHVIGSNSDLFTFGVLTKGKQDDIFYEAQVATQFGKTGVKIGTDDETYGGLYLNAMAGLKLDKKMSVALSYESLSGDDDKKKDGAFNPFAGTNHKFNGFMDKFFVGGHKIAGINGLQDIMLRFKYNSLMVDIHNFTNGVAPVDPTDVTKKLDKAIGNEIDITYKNKHSKNLSMVFGLSMFMFGDDYKNSSDKNDFYLYSMFIFNL